MGRPLRSVALVGAMLVAAASCSSGDDDTAPAASADAANATSARSRAGDRADDTPPLAPPPAPAPSDAPPSSADLDRVVAGRSVREWIAVIAADDRSAPQALADARAALTGDRESAARALIAMLAADPGEGWTRIRLLAQDLREELVPGLLPLLTHGDPVVRSTAFNELERMAKSGGFGARDGDVVRAFLADGLDDQELQLLRGMGPAVRPAVAEIIETMRQDDGGGHWDEDTFQVLASLGDGAAGVAPGIARFLDLEREENSYFAPDWHAFAALAAVPLGDAPGAPPSPEVIAALRRALVSGRPGWMSGAVRVFVAHGLGGDATAAVLAALEGSDIRRRSEALMALWSFDMPPPGAVAAVLRAAAADEDLAWTAGSVLGAWASRDDGTLAALLAAARSGPLRSVFEVVLVSQPDLTSPPPIARAFRSGDAAIRLAAVQFIAAGVQRFYRPTALRWARALSDDRDPAVAAAAREVAARWDAEDRAAGRAGTTSEVVARLLNGSPSERAAAAEAIRTADAEPVEVVQSLVLLLAEKNDWTRYSALGALAAIGPRAAGALPSIAQILANPQSPPYVHDAAARAAGAIGGEGMTLLAEQVRRRGETAGLIAGIGALPASSVPAMLEALNDRDADVRAAFLRGLRWHDAERDSVVGRARTLLGDASASVRVAAAGTVLRHVGGDGDAIRVLADVLRAEIGPDDDVLNAAVWEAAELGSGAVALLPEITRVLRNPVECGTWCDAAVAAGNCGESGAPAASALASGLDGRVVCTATYCDHSDSRALAAIGALRRLGPGASSVRAAIERATRHADPRVATIARTALASLDEKQAVAGVR